ncbi:MAG: hypothetical protein AABZ39_16960 [Spirochaetota bacterium]
MHKYLCAFVFLACSLLLGSAPAHRTLTRILSRGEIVFSEYTMYAEGKAQAKVDGPLQAVRIRTQRTAEETAAANLLASASGIIVSADTTVGDLAASSEVNRRILRSLSRYSLVSVNFLTNEAVSVRLSVPLLGADNLIAITRESTLNDALARTGTVTPKTYQEAGTNFTSLIIDAHDVNAECALLPAIYDTAGTLIYGIAYADGASVSRHGLVSYLSSSGIDNDYISDMEKLRELHALARALKPILLERDLRKKERALEVFDASAEKTRWAKSVAESIDRTMHMRTSVNNKATTIDEAIRRATKDIEKRLKGTRFGYAPFFVTAWRVRGAKKCDLVIAPDDGRIVLGNRTLLAAMKECRVAIIVE